MRKYKTSVGQRFSRLVVIGGPFPGKPHSWWKCVCDCRTETAATQTQLHTGKKRSCGCLHREVIRTHGDSESREYKIWCGMLNRAHHGSGETRNYLDRGIRVCRRWLVYENFLHDMGRSPPGTSLDRRDNNKGYSPSNCRWADQTTQMNNTRVNNKVRYMGETRSLTDWGRRLGFGLSTLSVRYSRGDRGRYLFRKKQGACERNVRLITVAGQTKTLKTWAAEVGVTPGALHYRYALGDRGAHLLRPKRYTDKQPINVEPRNQTC
jgi:hypothetical protein